MSRMGLTVYDLMKNNFDFGLDDYPIFDENYRPILNNAILEYYMFYEICYSNPWKWRNRINYTMRQIMRNKYNDMYKVKQTEFNPLYNIEITETYEHNIENTGENKSSATSSGRGSQVSNGSVENSGNSSGKNKVQTTDSQHGTGSAFTGQFPTQEMVDADLKSSSYLNGGSRTKEDKDSNNVAETESSANTKENTSTVDSSTTNQESAMENSASGKNNMKENYTKRTTGSSAGLPFSKALLQFQDYCNKYDLDQQVINELKIYFNCVWHDED